MLLHALDYAKRGWAVFPLVPRGKTPLVKTGFKAATIDVHQVSAWWTQWPDANIGIACGASGLFVVDLDGEEGTKSWIRIANNHGKPPATLLAQTGGGGFHVIFRACGLGNSASHIGPKIDTRGDGGYIVAAPSMHPSGERYKWINELEPSHTPAWIIALLGGDAATQPRQMRSAAPHTKSVWDSPYGMAALELELTELIGAQEGTRNHTLNVAAFSLGQLVAGGELQLTTVADALHNAGHGLGLTDNEIARTIASGLAAAALHPRVAPNPHKVSSNSFRVPAHVGRPNYR